GGGFGRFALKARANVVGGSVALTNVNVELDGNVAEGVMTFANNGRQTVQATLAAGNLDFTPYISTVRLLASGARDWRRQLFELTDVDLQAAAGELFGVTKLSGRGNLSVSLVASGASPFGLASSLDGTASLTGHDGAIAGFNVEQLLKRLERRPLSGAGNFRQGSTPYDSLTVSVKFADGIATAEDVRVESPG